MIKIINKVIVLVIISLLTLSCENEESLQQYFVKSEQKDDMYKFDIPTSLLSFNDDTVSEDAKEALESLDRLNVLAFKLNDDNKALYLEEKSKVNLILKNKSYRDLFKANTNGVKIVVKYIGTDETMDEVIFYANDSKKGFALGRILGNDMRPEKMMKLLESTKDFDKNSDAFKGLENLFNSTL